MHGVINYYNPEIGKWRFFFTDAIISKEDLENDSKTFKFSAINEEHKSSLVD
ncbi:hypothetical protein P0092_16025 [Ruminiclostridium papyrosolvens DSM 2782]|uniref:hypothetical protein n=1 Tax=Ruminiclostridium papyrosolvens TaxID=29362 RepID=UPI0001B2662D|nr:hypothetical protein [Ruminiclostridium papyrosolvens]WES33258.1 hypothetical protein P0092_16025 [Ruminiclostridium papyrosolvens DSM 2782]